MEKQYKRFLTEDLYQIQKSKIKELKEKYFKKLLEKTE
jgi:hypothetical protein